MKNLKFGMFALLIGMFASCDNNDDTCHECHMAYIVDNVEIAVEIGEFCGSVRRSRRT